MTEQTGMIQGRVTMTIMVRRRWFSFVTSIYFRTDAHSRSYGYGSPPRRGGGGYSGRRAPVDPHTLDYPASLKQYADWFRYFFPQQAIEEDNADKAATQEAGDGSKPRNGIKSKWEKYKKEFASQQVCILMCSTYSYR
jgi:hypothetical protein